MSRFLKILAVSFLSGLVTWIAYTFETQSALNHRNTQALQWARQIETQVETLIIYARERREPDPVGWAIRFFKVGSEGRPFKISSFSNRTARRKSESYELREET